MPAPCFLNRFGAAKDRLPHSDFLSMLFENALAHEQDVIADLVYETPGGATLKERASATLELMRAGGPERIDQAVFLQVAKAALLIFLERLTVIVRNRNRAPLVS